MCEKYTKGIHLSVLRENIDENWVFKQAVEMFLGDTRKQ